MSTEEPTVSKVVVPFNQLDAISFAKTELVRTTSDEVIYSSISATLATCCPSS